MELIFKINRKLLFHSFVFCYAEFLLHFTQVEDVCTNGFARRKGKNVFAQD